MKTWRWPWQAPVFDPAPGDLIEWAARDHSVWFPTKLRGTFVGWEADHALVERKDGSRTTVFVWEHPRIVERRAPAEPEKPMGYR